MSGMSTDGNGRLGFAADGNTLNGIIAGIIGF